MQCGFDWCRAAFPKELNVGALYSDVERIGKKREHPIHSLGRSAPIAQTEIGLRTVVQRDRIARVDLFGVSIRSERLHEMPGASFDRGRVEDHVAVVGKRLRRELQFAQRSVVIAFDVVMIKAEREVSFAKIRLESQRFERFDLRLLFPRLDWFVEVVYEAGRCREARTSKGELRIEFHRLIEKIYR